MITATHLTKRFKDMIAVDDVSFDVKDGEVVAFLGPNGAGTSSCRGASGLARIRLRCI